MLSLSGIMFVTVVTVANSLNAERMARFYMFPNGDLQLRIQSVETSTFDTSSNVGDRVSKLQRENNPLNDELISHLYSIKGVQKVTAENAVNLYIQYQENSLFSSIAGSGGLTSTLSQEQCAMISDALIEGTSDYDILNAKMVFLYERELQVLILVMLFNFLGQTQATTNFTWKFLL